MYSTHTELISAVSAAEIFISTSHGCTFFGNPVNNRFSLDWNKSQILTPNKRHLSTCRPLPSFALFPCFGLILPPFTLFCLRWLPSQRSQKQREELMAKIQMNLCLVGLSQSDTRGCLWRRTGDMWLLQTELADLARQMDEDVLVGRPGSSLFSPQCTSLELRDSYRA